MKPFSHTPDSKPPIWKNSTPAWAVGRMEPLKRVGLSQEPAWFRQHKSSKPMSEPQKTSGAPQPNASQASAPSQPQNASVSNSPASAGGASGTGTAQPPAAAIQQNSAAEMTSAAASQVASLPKRSDDAESSRVTADVFPAVSPLSGNSSGEQSSAPIPRREAESVSRESAQTPSSAEQNSEKNEKKEDAGASAQAAASAPTDAAAVASAAAPAPLKTVSQKDAEESSEKNTPSNSASAAEVSALPESEAVPQTQDSKTLQNVQAAPSSSPEQPKVIQPRKTVTEVHVAPAGIISRNIARLMDCLCLTAIVALVLLLAESVTGFSLLSLSALKTFALPLAGLFCALSFAYFTLFHALGGRTPGKWVVGIYVLDNTGRPPSLGRSMGRTLAAFLSAAILFLGFLISIFSKERQTLHDKIAGTHVVWLIRIS